MGIEILTEEQYRECRNWERSTRNRQVAENAAHIRKLGGAIFGDRRFGRVFVYHNGAQLTIAGGGFVAAQGVNWDFELAGAMGRC